MHLILNVAYALVYNFKAKKKWLGVPIGNLFPKVSTKFQKG